MSDYRHGSHTTFSIHLHIVWITKYRHKVFRGEVAERVRAHCPRRMSEGGRRYPPRAYLVRSCPCHGLHPAAGHDQSPDPTDEREKLPIVCSRNFRSCASGFGGAMCGHEATSVAAVATSLTRSSRRTLRNSRTTVMTCFGSRARRPRQGTPREGTPRERSLALDFSPLERV